MEVMSESDRRRPADYSNGSNGEQDGEEHVTKRRRLDVDENNTVAIEDEKAEKTVLITGFTSWWNEDNLADFLTFRMERHGFIPYFSTGAVAACSIDEDRATVEFQSPELAQMLLSLDDVVRMNGGSSILKIWLINEPEPESPSTLLETPLSPEGPLTPDNFLARVNEYRAFLDQDPETNLDVTSFPATSDNSSTNHHSLLDDAENDDDDAGEPSSQVAQQTQAAKSRDIHQGSSSSSSLSDTTPNLDAESPADGKRHSSASTAASSQPAEHDQFEDAEGEADVPLISLKSDPPLISLRKDKPLISLRTRPSSRTDVPLISLKINKEMGDQPPQQSNTSNEGEGDQPTASGQTSQSESSSSQPRRTVLVTTQPKPTTTLEQDRTSNSRQQLTATPTGQQHSNTSPPSTKNITESADTTSADLSSSPTSDENACEKASSNSNLPGIESMDVLCDGGSGATSHKGNKLFFKLVQDNHEAYFQAKSKNDKWNVAMDIVKQVRTSGGRFLKCNETSVEWVEVSRNKAAETTVQTLRDSTLRALLDGAQDKAGPPNQMPANEGHDVLCGSPEWTKEHVGNQRFLYYVAKYKKIYVQSKNKGDKLEIAKHIVEKVQRFGGRFIEYKASSDAWVEVSLFKALGKTLGALREGTPPSPSTQEQSNRPARPEDTRESNPQKRARLSDHSPAAGSPTAGEAAKAAANNSSIDTGGEPASSITQTIVIDDDKPAEATTPSPTQQTTQNGEHQQPSSTVGPSRRIFHPEAYVKAIKKLQAQLKEQEAKYDTEIRYMRGMHEKAVNRANEYKKYAQQFQDEKNKWANHGKEAYRQMKDAKYRLENAQAENRNLQSELSATKHKLDKVHHSWQDQYQQIDDLKSQLGHQKQRSSAEGSRLAGIEEQLQDEIASRKEFEKKFHEMVEIYAMQTQVLDQERHNRQEAEAQLAAARAERNRFAEDQK